MIFAFKKHPIIQLVNDHLIEYPTPSNLTLWWNYGFLAGMCLSIQLITGIALAMHYTPHVDIAFLSTEHIMRDVNSGWLLRYIHANGASMFFYSCLRSHWSWFILWFVYWAKRICLNTRCYNIIINDGNSILRLCFGLRSNEFLSCDSNYKFFYSISNCRW